MKKITIWIGIIVVVVVAALWYKASNTKDAGTGTTVTSDYKNATYNIEGQSVTLVNGVSEVPAAPGSASKVTTKYFGNNATADLNGDGKEDTAFILTQNSGGSGTFYYVVVALKTADGYQGTNGVVLGDRIAPQTTEVKNAQVVVNYADRAAGEPMTAQPSVAVSKYLEVRGTELVEVAAPVASDTWKTFNGATSTFTFQYPDHLTTQFITAQAWPPTVTLASGTFSCTEGGSQTTLPGSFTKKTINGRIYCVKLESEGAAGSTYVTYDYTTEKTGKLVTVEFTLRMVQCANYDDPQKTACEKERNAFNIDSVIDRIAQSVVMK
jgi:hypothetical protein